MATTTINGLFEGYLWRSDSQVLEEIYYGEKLKENLTVNDDENPFIIEGQLYDKLTGLSVSIKYVDGRHLVKKYYVESSSNGKTRVFFVDDGEKKEVIDYEVKNLHFKGNSRLNGHNLHFIELWEEMTDELCCGMGVLEATKVIFVGFE